MKKAAWPKMLQATLAFDRLAHYNAASPGSCRHRDQIRGDDRNGRAEEKDLAVETGHASLG